MNTDNLVNGYVIPNLLYELIFLDEHGVESSNEDWANDMFTANIVQNLITPRFESFTPQTKTVIKNTLKYLLSTETNDSELWERIWQASSAPIPTPHGVRHFMEICYNILFPNEALLSLDDLMQLYVNHDEILATRLN